MNKFLKKVIHERAKRMHSAPLPADIARGDIGDCFDHCVIQALKSNGKYRYVEGLAYINKEWIYHAWLTDEQCFNAFDPTWKMETGAGEIKNIPSSFIHYLGVVMDLQKVIEFMKKTEYKAVLKNYYRAADLAKEAVTLSYPHLSHITHLTPYMRKKYNKSIINF